MDADEDFFEKAELLLTSWVLTHRLDIQPIDLLTFKCAQMKTCEYVVIIMLAPAYRCPTRIGLKTPRAVCFESRVSTDLDRIHCDSKLCCRCLHIFYWLNILVKLSVNLESPPKNEKTLKWDVEKPDFLVSLVGFDLSGVPVEEESSLLFFDIVLGLEDSFVDVIGSAFLFIKTLMSF